MGEHVLLSIITATRGRPELLAKTLQSVSEAGFSDVEHLVVSDGPDQLTEVLCRQFAGARYLPIEAAGQWGASARDAGIAAAAGRYMAFWDDDNIYYGSAVAKLRTAALAAKAGSLLLFQVWHNRPTESYRQLMPYKPGIPDFGFVDTMCFCVDAILARQVLWADDGGRGHDYRWMLRLAPLAAAVEHIPVVLGEHLNLHQAVSGGEATCDVI